MSQGIPTDEDFVRAKRKMREQDTVASEVKNRVMSRFSNEEKFHDLWLFPAGKGGFIATVFYVKSRDIDLAESSGLSSKLETAIKEDFAQQHGLQCSVEFDSHEEVLRKFNGNYDRYFR